MTTTESTAGKRSRANTRARLLEAAYRVFAEKGFAASTIEDVCEAAGFTRGAFYSNFASMNELFFALWRHRNDAFVARLADIAAAARDEPRSADRLLEAMTTTVDDESRTWFLVNTDFLLHALRHPELAAELAVHRRRLRQRLGTLVADHLDRRGRHLAPGIGADLAARLVLAVSEGGLHQVLVEPDDADARRLRGLLVDGLLERFTEPGP